MGQDAEERTCDSPQLLVPAGDLHHPDASLSASAPSSSAVPPARPSPTQQHAADASTLLIRKASSIRGGSVPFLSSLPGSHAQAAPFPARAPSHSRASPILSLTGHTWGCPSWSPAGTGAIAKAPQHLSPCPAPAHSQELCTQGLQTQPGAQRRQEKFLPQGT